MKKYLFVLSILFFGFNFPSEKIRIFMIGDSTMANKKPYDAPETGWGQVFHEFFTDAVLIQNHALNGRSTKSFRNEGHWAKVHEQLQKGDYVFIQFGHNDQKSNDSTRYSDPQVAYRANLQRYIDEVKAKGAIPVLLTPMSRRKFNDDHKFVDQHGEYPQVVKEVAKKNQVDLIDMHALSQKLIENLGEEASKDVFMHYAGGIYDKFPNGIVDNTHLSNYGAKLMSSMVAENLMAQSLPLRNWLKKSVYPNTLEYQLPKINTPAFKKDTFEITRYGAKGDGLFLNTKAIQQAIDIATEKGGGTVLIPSGLWITGPVVLKNNINLHLAKGAVLQFSDNRNDYPIVETTWEGNTAYRCQAPIWGVNLTNVALTGQGTMDGAGQVWKQVKKSKLTDTQWKNLVASGGVLNDKKDTWYPSETSKYGNENMAWTNKKTEGKTLEDYQKIRDFLRPNFISLSVCRNVLIEGITFLNSPAWTLHPLLCEHITIRNVNVKNPWFGQNNDALDLESCSNGIVENSTFDTGDDAICIKSGRDEEGRKRGKPTQNIIVRNNTVFHAHGGFVIGSEMSGGVKNLYVNNNNFLGTDIGLRFKTARGRGGVVENIYISDINMNNIPGEAILFDMYYMAKDTVPLDGDDTTLPEIKAEKLDESTPSFKSFFIENVNCKGAETAIMLRGLPEMNIKDINIKNSNFTSNKGLICIEAENISFENVGIFSKNTTVGQIQNSKNISFNHINFSPKSETLLEISGERNRNITLVNTQKSNLKEVATFKAKADKKVFRMK
ncbi:glycosyl hydrolase family 28 protein [Lacihabitans soyangensis]|uniref:GDSL family lipase n=1 Tax=Lacihabitans soyangensis TaxID=869394 RepID=A0AAE3KVJ2_9BACT|nr:glycosyl hydrolase family 28 protein [Lacihabitans soyangensis]MCP9766268.1 GDSL family lipase [Lacihabitans soyangensis]